MTVDILIGYLINFSDEIKEKIIESSDCPELVKSQFDAQLKTINDVYANLLEKGYECYTTEGPNGMTLMFAKVNLDSYWKFIEDTVCFDDEEED